MGQAVILLLLLLLLLILLILLLLLPIIITQKNKTIVLSSYRQHDGLMVRLCSSAVEARTSRRQQCRLFGGARARSLQAASIMSFIVACHTHSLFLVSISISLSPVCCLRGVRGSRGEKATQHAIDGVTDGAQRVPSKFEGGRAQIVAFFVCI
jgi:hypothetical protein